MTTIPLGVRIRPSRKGRVYRAYYNELRQDLVEAMKMQERTQHAGIFTSTEIMATVTLEVMRKFAKKSPSHYEYLQLILEVWE